MSTWLSDDLKAEVRRTFEPRYRRELSDEEVIEIGSNLAEFTEHVVKFAARRRDGLTKET